MPIYVIIHSLIFIICVTGFIRSWRVLKKYPDSIYFAKMPLSLLVVMAFCSAVTVLDLIFVDFVSNSVLNILAAVQLLYAALIAAISIPYLARIRREQ